MHNMAASAATGSANTPTAAQSVSAQSTGGRANSLPQWENALLLRADDAGQYPPLPAGAQARPVATRPSAIVNKDAVARVQAQQAAMKAKAAAPAGMSQRICRV